jgi:hypothetical protein
VPVAPEPSEVQATERPGLALAQQVAGIVLDGIRAEPAPVVAGQPPAPPRSRDSVLVALVIAGALLYQRGEVTADAVAEQARDAAAYNAKMEERMVSYERGASVDRQQALHTANTIREALYILSADRRSVWDALAQIHAAIKDPGTPDLRQSGTEEQLTALREAMAVERRDVP